MAYSALKCATAETKAAALKNQPRGLAGGNDSAEDREANREDCIFEPVVEDVSVWVREVQVQEQEA